MSSATALAALGQVQDVRAPGDETWRAFDPSQPPEPGTQLRIRGADGRLSLTTYNGGDPESDTAFTEPKPSTASAKATDYPAAEDIAPHAPDYLKQLYETRRASGTATDAELRGLVGTLRSAETAAGKSGAADAALQAAAQAGRDRLTAGLQPTAAQLSAMERIGTTGGVTGGSPDTLGWLKTQMGAGNGTQGFGTGSDWNAKEVGQDVNTPLHTGVPLVAGTVTAVTPWGNGDYALTVRRPDGTEVTVGHIADPSATYSVGQTVTNKDVVFSRGADEQGQGFPGFSSGPQVEIRVKPANGDFVDPVQYAQSQPASGGSGVTLPPDVKLVGSKLVQVDPVSGKSTVVYDGTGDRAPTLHTIGDKGYVFDPSTRTLTLVADNSGDPQKVAQAAYEQAQAAKINQDLLPKAQLALQQHAATIDYIKQALANGTITLDEANRYQDANNSILQASLQGTTPYELQQLQEQQATQRAQIGKDIIDQQLQSGTQLTQSLLASVKGLTVSPGSFNPLTAGRLMVDDLSGGEDTGALAKSLVQGITPGAAPPSPSAISDQGVPPVGSINPLVTPPPGSTAPEGGELHADMAPSLADQGPQPAVGSAQAQNAGGGALAMALARGLMGGSTSDVQSLLNQGPQPAVGSAQAQEALGQAA